MKTKQITLLVTFIIATLVVAAQNTPSLSWSTIDNEVSNATTSLRTIIGYIVGIVITIGFLYTLYNVITGKSDSREKLGYFIGGLALYIIALALNWI